MVAPRGGRAGGRPPAAGGLQDPLRSHRLAGRAAQDRGAALRLPGPRGRREQDGRARCARIPRPGRLKAHRRPDLAAHGVLRPGRPFRRAGPHGRALGRARNDGAVRLRPGARRGRGDDVQLRRQQRRHLPRPAAERLAAGDWLSAFLRALRGRLGGQRRRGGGAAGARRAMGRRGPDRRRVRGRSGTMSAPTWASGRSAAFARVSPRIVLCRGGGCDAGGAPVGRRARAFKRRRGLLPAVVDAAGVRLLRPSADDRLVDLGSGARSPATRRSACGCCRSLAAAADHAADLRPGARCWATASGSRRGPASG